jgi:hypothetical protein
MGMEREKTAGMSLDEVADWKDAITIFVTDLKMFGENILEGDFSDLNDLVRQMSDVRKEQINLDDEVLDRDVDNGLELVVRMLNEVESERRRWEDEERKHGDRCRDFSRKAKELSAKFKTLEGRK